jgi:hypothetical protein
MPSNTTLSADTEEISYASVQSRVSDWRNRIDALYRDLIGWSPPDLRCDQSQRVTMHEEMMKAYGVAPIELPVLNIFDSAGWKAKIIPYGLWIIGGNGRLDLLADGRRYLITGLPADVGSGWSISEPGSGWDTKPLDQSSWLAALQ